jgi:hypothetical protein
MDPEVSIDAEEISRRIRRQANSQDKGQKCIFLSCSFMCSMSKVGSLIPEKEMSLKRGDLQPGDMVLIDEYVSTVPG